MNHFQNGNPKKIELKKNLGVFQLWAICVGLVMSGQYFGWSYGWAEAGTLGFLITTLIVSFVFICLTLCFTELAVSIPNSGGPFAYAYKAFGEKIAFIVGFASLVEIFFASPAIALAIGSYVNAQFPAASPKLIACAAYLIFMLLNIFGVALAATFELLITLLAVVVLLIFIGILLPQFQMANLVDQGWNGNDIFSFSTLIGIIAAIPFALWFFMGIEGASMVSEEVKNPKKTIPIAYICGIITLVILSLGVMLCAGGVGDWKLLSDINDPLPQAIKQVVGSNSIWFHLLVWFGLLGLMASFHGVILSCSRQVFALARAHYLPSFLAKISYRFRTPYMAIIVGGIIGILVIFSDEIIHVGGHSLTANFVTIAVFGAIFVYIFSILSLFQLRKKYPNSSRSYSIPGYPFVPMFALILSILFLITMIFYHIIIMLVFLGALLLTYTFHFMQKKKFTKQENQELSSYDL